MDDLNSHTLNELQRQLHDATAHLREARHAWEASLDNAEFRHQQRVDAAWDQLRHAEQGVEAIENKIHRALAGENDPVDNAVRGPVTSPDA